ncbi:MAG: GAF and ANTAR domain-containing protein [Nocardioides sp.]
MTAQPDAEEFAELALDLHDVPFEETVDRVLEFAVKALNCSYAGVILVHAAGDVETVARTHPVVAELDAIQMQTGQGPDLDVIADRHTVLVRDAKEDGRWPQWSEKVVAAGVRSMLGTRLYTTKTTIGSLNFYDSDPDHFDEADVDVAHMLARHAAVAMESARGAENLWKAIDARNLIGQAQGILMERFGVDSEQAFGVLRRYSQDNNIRLHLVAEKLIATRSLPG